MANSRLLISYVLQSNVGEAFLKASSNSSMSCPTFIEMASVRLVLLRLNKRNLGQGKDPLKAKES